MKKSYSLFIVLIIVCIYSCNNNYVVGPTNPTENHHDTVFFQSMDSFNIYLNPVTPGVDTFIQKDTTFSFLVLGQTDIVLKYTGVTDHSQATTIVDSSVDVKIAMGDTSSTLSVPDSATVIFEMIDSQHVAGAQYLDTYRHTRFTFAKCHIRLRINHNHAYGDLPYYIKLLNLKFYRVT